MEEKRPLDPSASVSKLETTIAALETQLHEKDTQLREKQTTLLSLGRTQSSVSLGDSQARERFSRLRSGISDWVARNFSGSSFSSSPSLDVVTMLKRSQPQYEALIQDSIWVAPVLQGLVADMICQAFASGQLLGNEAFWELKHSIGAKGEPFPIL
jgi:hypothetical protein